MKKALLIIFSIISFHAFSQDVNMQNGSVTSCSDVFYDSGGPGGAYASNENLVLTICPDSAGQLVQLNFTEFSTQLGADVMTIFNGDSVASPAFGTFDGANSPGFVTATDDNGSGCLTIQFVSDGTGTTTGWAANISCFTPCQTITSQIDTATPAPNGDGYIRVCPGEDITLTGSGNFEFDGTGATYEWDLGDGNLIAGQTATFSYAVPGVYIVNLNVRDANTDSDPLGCPNTNLINQVIQVATEPDFTGTQAADDTLCFGETTTIDGVVNPVPFVNDCTPPVSGTTFLPDGSGAVYTTCITVDCFESDQLLDDPAQLIEICVNMEHSYSGDLDIKIISPNGQEADLFTQAGGGTYFGGANDDGSNTPGIGADYCFSMSATTLLSNANTIIAGSNPPNNSWAPGTYLPVESFNALVGSPLNGDWCIEIVDNLTIDNGYVFSWGLNFDPSIQPPELSFTPVIVTESWDADPTITNVTGSTITVAPPTAGTYCYTYRVTDDFGCEYTEEVCITMDEEVVADVTAVINPICNGDDAVFLITGSPNATINYTINAGGNQTVVLDGTGSATVTVTAPAVDQVFNLVDATVGACTVAINDTETILVGQVFDTSFATTPTCDGGTAIVTGDLGGVFAFEDPQPTDGAVIDPATGTVTGGTPGATYIIVYEFASSCTPGNTETLTVLPEQDASFNLTATCDGATATITGDLGGTFVFNPVPADGAVLDLLTGTITNGTQGATYTVEYSVAGACPAVSTESVTVLAFEDSSFTLTPTCDGATATILGDAGGIFALVPDLGDGAVIDANTGTITNGVSGTLYTVEYTTSGPCPETTSQSVTVFSAEDASFSLTPSCTGATATITGDLGGVFSFNPVPGDGALIDPATGEITNGGSGVTYTVEYTTIGNCPETVAQSVTVFPEDDSSFTMATTCDGATATITGLPGGTFAFNPIPGDGAIIDPATGTVTGGAFDTTYTVEYTSNGVCPTTSSQTFTVFSQPVVIAPTPLAVCDDGTPDGITIIDLTLKNVEVTGNNPNYSVSYHIDQFDADNNLNPLAIPYTNLFNGQIVFVRVQDINTGCYDTTTLELVVEQAPIANTPTPLLYCDPDSDGFGVFDLTSKDIEITGGDPALTVSYHETMADANNNVNALTSPYNNIVENQQTVYVRVESSTIATACATIVELQLIVSPTPQLGSAPTALEVCDDLSADGFAQFDLTSKIPEILQNLADPTLYTVTFYETEMNADMSNNPIATPANYTNTTAFNQILWVRVEDIDPATGCYKLTTLELIVNALPVLLQPAPLELCDDNNPGDEVEFFMLEDATDEILNGQTGISLTYFATQVDADNNTNAITSPYENTSNPQTIFVRATNDITGCFVSTTATILLRVNPIPSPTVPTDLEECDEDNDGFTEFNLEDRTLEIIGGELDIAITYHETQQDAETGDNALASPYTNIVMDEQMIYIRATNTVTGCYNASEVLIIRVLESPEVPVTIVDYVICDTNSDGITQFDLTTKDAEILGGQTDVTLTYHVTAADALTGNNAIANVGNYTNTSNPQTIYVRLVSNINGCVDVGQFDLRVELPPVAVQPTPLELCDDEIDDEITVFDLTVKDVEITGGEASWSVSYYETDVDAQAQTNAVDAGAYTNTSVNGLPANPQTLYVVVTDTDTGCVDFTTLTIRVLPNPTPTEVLPELVLCDDINPGDMEEVFDLTTNEVLLLNGEVGVTPSYHETLEDAEEGINAIADPTMYTNTSTPQLIYVRVTNDITGCYTIVNFTLLVNPLPDVVAVTDFIACELNNDGFYDFDLTLKDAEVLNGQDATLFTVTYHETQADADALINALVSPYTNLTNPQQIFVAITNNDTGCSISTPSFNIEVQEAAEANSDMEPIVFEICDDEMDDDNDPTNNSAQFDLTLQNDAILDGQDPANYIVSYYASEADAELGVNPLPFLYENVVNPQVIWARVDNDTLDVAGMDTSICYAVAPLTLQVNPLPVFDLEDSYILCVDTNGSEVLNLPVLETGLDTGQYTFVWFFNGTEIAGATDSSYMPSEGGTYSVTVTDVTSSPNTMCESSDITEVIESSPPTVMALVVSLDFADVHVIEVTVEGSGDYEYSLDGGPWQDENIFTDVSIGDHTVTVRDKIGCGEASDDVTVMDYPKFFTPNGDGYNDTWNITDIDNQPNAKIYIFDRYGKLIKQLSPSGIGWNGTYNGNPMPTSDYWFVVEYNERSTGERKEFKAHFTLKR
ncbi:gliding motility-associated C-terminal domain-containing protein [Formosa sp. Hel1_31_208]|uniref:T9SS type B sorting domain-containing protein n=1 Tax=Formosa sp. Hel1_31_208 TaxID=1798225 RepID=UPI000879A8CE|nr:T9SS type B sorting domain-containing protein [Formosa sp. Hel1_31_208]SDS10232.1 gliding motility-associated C-terminal domain-containing protein [Formosa sp. Hel1_31_208]